MINKNITIIIALISTTYIQQIDAAQQRSIMPSQHKSPYHSETDETQLTQAMHIKTGQWYNAKRCDLFPSSRAECHEFMAAGYAAMPMFAGLTIFLGLLNNYGVVACTDASPISFIAGLFASALCKTGCQCFNCPSEALQNERNAYNKAKYFDISDGDRNSKLQALQQNIDEKLGQWYTVGLWESPCYHNADACTRSDCYQLMGCGYACVPACAGVAGSLAAHSMIPASIGTAACLLCLYGCTYDNNPYDVAREEKDLLKIR